jgi:hypothetical protein
MKPISQSAHIPGAAPLRGSTVRLLLRLEGLAVAAVTVAVYAHLGASWLVFAALWLAPDLSMLGYLAGSCWGARVYNAVHAYVAPAVLALCGLLLHTHLALPIALIWANHIGVDRLGGFGLKYAEGFGWTHLSAPSEAMGRERSGRTPAVPAPAPPAIGRS